MSIQPLTATLRYSPALGDKVAWHYIRRHFGPMILFGALVPIFTILDYFFADAFFLGFWSIILIVVLLGYLFVVKCYFVVRRRYFESLTRMGSPDAVITLTDENFSVVSGAGASSIPWRHFTKLLKYPEFWVLSVGETSALTLPLDGANTAFLKFIEQKVPIIGPNRNGPLISSK